VSERRSDGLRQALELSPDNHALRAVLAETLEAEGDIDEAIDEYAVLLDAGQLDGAQIVRVGALALQQGKLALAGRFLEAAKRSGVVEGVTELQTGLEHELADEGVVRLVRHGPPDSVAALELEAELGPVTFSDVGGLEDVKKTIHRTIILPYQRPDLYRRYGREAGAGVMLYGPPGCGKTLLARATAGECGLPFFNIRIEDVLDPYLGMAERALHESFVQAREHAPCVLFIDELDALAYARRKQQGSAGRALVDQLLQELDAIGADNRDLLILSATNAPWDVDDGLKRPGRLDRLVFVPPPDEPARRRILELHLEGRPAEGMDLARLAKETPLFSGADLRDLVERAVDDVIEQALDTGTEPPLTMEHLERARASRRPTTLDWLGTARNYVEFANQAGRYDDVLEYLKSREARRLSS
jgi:transitional endoplasmic reticulum ATPase